MRHISPPDITRGEGSFLPLHVVVVDEVPASSSVLGSDVLVVEARAADARMIDRSGAAGLTPTV